MYSVEIGRHAPRKNPPHSHIITPRYDDTAHTASKQNSPAQKLFNLMNEIIATTIELDHNENMIDIIEYDQIEVQKQCFAHNFAKNAYITDLKNSITTAAYNNTVEEILNNPEVFVDHLQNRLTHLRSLIETQEGELDNNLKVTRELWAKISRQALPHKYEKDVYAEHDMYKNIPTTNDLNVEEIQDKLPLYVNRLSTYIQYMDVTYNRIKQRRLECVRVLFILTHQIG